MQVLKHYQVMNGRSSYITKYLNHAAVVRMFGSENVKWLWEANSDIQELHRANIQGTRIGGLTATLNSTIPLESSHFVKTLEHLQRKTPHINAYLKYRGNKLCFFEPSKLNMDFQELDEGIESREGLLHAIKDRFQTPDMTQSRFRLIRQSQDAVCPIPEIKESHPHQYGILFTSHHGFMDGVSAGMIMRNFLSMLNKVAAGIHVDDKPLSVFYEDKEIPELLDRVKEKFSQNSDLVDAVSRTRPPPDHIPIFFQAFPSPKVSQPTTKHITRLLESEVLTKFQSKCREEGVTFNSGLVALLNTAIKELVRSKGILLDHYEIRGIIMTSLRRYMRPSENIFYGHCATQFHFTSMVDKDIRDSFWNYCKGINQEIHSSIRQGLPLQQKALQQVDEANQPPYDYVNKIRPALHDYSLTNLGDLTKLLQTPEKVVLVTRIASMNMIHNSLYSNLHEVLSFNGRSYYTLSYATNYFTDETAALLLDKIFHLLEDFS